MAIDDYENKKNVLVALLKDQRDEEFLTLKKWYRIPCDTKNIPLMVKNKTIKYIAFYLPRKFGKFQQSIPLFAKVNDIKIVKRKELFFEHGSTKNNKNYYKIEIEKLEELNNAIYAQRKRRFLFLTTTEEKFKNATELNDLFDGTPLEETLWDEFKKNKIQAERQWEFTVDRKKYYLDFALMCKNGKIDVECDGDSYHSSKEQIQHDNERNNLLTKKKWQVLRFNTNDIIKKIDYTVDTIMETIDKYGGIEEINQINNTKTYRFVKKYGTQDELFQIP